MSMPIVVFLIAGVAACDPLVNVDYAGEPLVRLQGVASILRKDAGTTQVDGAMLWQVPSAAGVKGFTRVPLRTEFPALWLDVVSLPRPEVSFQVASGEPVIAEAYLHVVRRAAGPVVRGDDFVATELGHALVYVGGELAPDGVTASYLGGALEPGFHIVRRSSTSELTAPQRQLVERCATESPGGPPDRIRASCTAQHLYRLSPTPDDVDTVLRFDLEPRS